MQNGLRFLYLVCYFSITVFHGFCGQIMVVCRSVSSSLLIAHTYSRHVVTRPQGWAYPQACGWSEGWVFFIPLILGIASLQPLGLVGWTSGERVRKGSVRIWLSETRFAHLQQIPGFPRSEWFLSDFEIGFLFRVKIRTRTGMPLWIRLCSLKECNSALGLSVARDLPIKEMQCPSLN